MSDLDPTRNFLVKFKPGPGTAVDPIRVGNVPVGNGCAHDVVNMVTAVVAAAKLVAAETLNPRRRGEEKDAHRARIVRESDAFVATEISFDDEETPDAPAFRP